MATVLKNVISFAAVAAGGTQTVAHGLVIEDVAVLPDKIDLNNGAFEVTLTTSTQITVQNNGQAAANCDALVERFHSQERVIIGANLAVQPFVANDGQSGQAAWPIGFFGDGSLGDLVLAGDHQVTGDEHYENLDLAGFNLSVGEAGTDTGRVFVRGVLTVRAASHLHGNGDDAALAVRGANGTGRVLDIGSDGGNGQNAAGANGVSVGHAYGGSGGAGGAGTGGAGGAAGVATPGTAGQETTPHQLPEAITGRYADLNAGTGYYMWSGGAGGGGGGGDGANPGGGGGAGGNILVICARQIVVEAGGFIEANGGAGADGPTINTGGGAGGGGGVVVIVAQSVVNAGTIQALGGAAGASGGGAGVAGAVGAVGAVIRL